MQLQPNIYPRLFYVATVVDTFQPGLWIAERQITSKSRHFSRTRAQLHMMASGQNPHKVPISLSR